MNWNGLAQKIDSHKHGCHPGAFIKCWDFLACLRNYWLLKKNCAP
jgi:hypothetical protein